MLKIWAFVFFIVSTDHRFTSNGYAQVCVCGVHTNENSLIHSHHIRARRERVRHTRTHKPNDRLNTIRFSSSNFYRHILGMNIILRGVRRRHIRWLWMCKWNDWETSTQRTIRRWVWMQDALAVHYKMTKTSIFIVWRMNHKYTTYYINGREAEEEIIHSK